MQTIEEYPVAWRRHIACEWVDDLNSVLSERDFRRAKTLFDPSAFWRDLLALTWEVRTIHGVENIARVLENAVPGSGAENFLVDTMDPILGRRHDTGEVTVEAFLTFETEKGNCRGFARLVVDPKDSKVRAWTFLTALQSLKNVPGKERDTRARDGVEENWLDRRTSESRFEHDEPEVVIIGAGHAGLGLAARLGQLNVKTLVIDREQQVGDNWRNRYRTLRLHNETWAHHMPYLPFPSTWPVYAPKDMLADWMQFYALTMELNVWVGTEFVRGDYDEVERHWNVEVQRPDGSLKVIQPRHIVACIGGYTVPKTPRFDGVERFSGVVRHATEDLNDLDVKGKTVLVVGASVSGHDVAHEMFLRGAQVTMLQRSPTTVVSLHPSGDRLTALYRNNDGVRPIDDTDLISASVPNHLLFEIQKSVAIQMRDDDREMLEGLTAAGFLHDNAMGRDGSGVLVAAMRNEPFYLNVGASELIISGQIALKTGTGVDHFNKDSVVFEDGTSMASEIVILATGYQSQAESFRLLFGNTITDRLGPIGGFGEDGEIRNMWKRTAQPGLFIHGGSFSQGRNYSRYVALQIKADLEGIIE